MSFEDQDATRPGTPGSDRSSESTKKSQIQHEQKDIQNDDDEKRTNEAHETTLQDGEGEAAIPEDRKVSSALNVVRAWSHRFNLSDLTIQEDAIENAEDDWAHDPRNPRIWGFWRKWGMVSIVSILIQ